MDKIVTDQAEGLRRLLARRPLRVVAVLGAHHGAGASTAAVNLCAGSCFHGKRAVVIDEHATSESIHPRLADLVNGRVLLDSNFFSPDDNRHAAILAASADSVVGMSGAEQLAVLDGSADIAYVDARLDEHGLFSPLALLAHDIVIVMDADAA